MADNGGGLTVKIPLVHLDGLLHPSVPPLLSRIPNVVPNGQESGAPIFDTNLPAEPRSLLGKVGHGLLEGLKVAGIGAGTVLDPNAMAMIPGTPEHALLQQAEQRKNELAQSQAAEAQAAAERQRATASQISQMTPAEVAEMGAKTGLEGAQTGAAEAGAALTTAKTGVERKIGQAMETGAASPTVAFPQWKQGEPVTADMMNQAGAALDAASEAVAGTPASIRLARMKPIEDQYMAMRMAYDRGSVLPSSKAAVGESMNANPAANLGVEASLSGAKAGASKASQLAQGQLAVIPDANGNVTFQVARPGAELPQGSMTLSQWGSQSTVPAQAKQRAEMAQQIQGYLDDTINNVHGLAQKHEIGPIAGRIQSLEQWVGYGDPQFKVLQSQLNYLRGAAANIHFGARGAQMDFQRSLELLASPHMTPDNLIAALGNMDQLLKGYAWTVEPPMAAGGASPGKSGAKATGRGPTGNTVSWKDLK